MKKLLFSWLLSVFFLSISYAQYDDALYDSNRSGYEGDYFSLEGALDLFKQSYSLRDFEKKLNTEENWVNNLDLNYDGRIDYIRVEHKRRGNIHAIILQALMDSYDVQDVAVIEMEIIGRREAVLQIIGDEDLYGEEVVVEPAEGYASSRSGFHSDYGKFVNVYYWDPVQRILDQEYLVYVSPYRWRYYPTWWSPWRQCSWDVFRPRIVIYHRHYHVVYRHRMVHVHNFYRTHRTYSYTVVERTNKVRVKHGKAPIHRPAPDRRLSDQKRGDKVVAQPRNNTGSRTARPNPSVSRDRTVSSSSPKATRSSSSVNRPSVNSKPTPSSDRKVTRSTASQTKPQSRNTTTRNQTTTRSTTSRERSSVNSRTAPSAKPRTNRSTTPRVQQPSRSKPSSSNTTTRSRTTTRKPSVSSGRSAPTSKPNVTKSNTSKGSSTKSGSRSNKGG